MEKETDTNPQIIDTVEPVINNDEPSKGKVVLWVVIGIILVALIVFAIVSLFQAEPETTSRIRDIFIIFMAFGALLLGSALIILVIQLATLINILKNEIRPILETTNETVNNLKGTTTFLSNNLVEPVMKMNEYLAGMKKFFDLVKPSRRNRE